MALCDLEGSGGTGILEPSSALSSERRSLPMTQSSTHTTGRATTTLVKSPIESGLERAALLVAVSIAVIAAPQALKTPQERITEAVRVIDDVAKAEPGLVVGTTSIYGHEDPAKGTYRIDAIIVTDEPLSDVSFEIVNLGQNYEADRSGEIVRSYDRPDGSVISVVRSAPFNGSIGDAVDYSIVAAGLPVIKASGHLEHDGTPEGELLTGPGVTF